jgi:hypothetical protein
MAKHAALPMKPLWDIARSMSDDPMFNQRDFARAVNHSTRAVTRWITAGETLSWVSADEAAIALGLHPILVWGEAWLNVRGELTDLEAEVIGDLETEALTDL